MAGLEDYCLALGKKMNKIEIKSWKNNKFFKVSDYVYRNNQDIILSLLDVDTRGSVLDVGCNAAEFSMKCAERINTKHIFGIEIDWGSTKQAGERINVINSDANRTLPFKDNSFDVIVANQVLEHLYSADHFFREAYRLLKRGGYIVLSTPNLSAWHSIFFMLLGMTPPGLHLSEIQVGNFLLKGTETHGHIRLFNVSALKDLAKYHNFQLERLVGFGYYPFVGGIANFLSKIDKRHSVFLAIKVRKI